MKQLDYPILINTKGKIPSLNLSSVVYKFESPGYSFSYVRKIRTQKHNNKKKEQSVIYGDMWILPP